MCVCVCDTALLSRLVTDTRACTSKMACARESTGREGGASNERESERGERAREREGERASGGAIENEWAYSFAWRRI